MKCILLRNVIAINIKNLRNFIRNLLIFIIVGNLEKIMFGSIIQKH